MSADTSLKRRTGLLKHSGLAPGEGLWIVPSEGVHTFGMNFTIDVAFLSKQRVVLKTRPHMVKGRILALSSRAFRSRVASRHPRRIRHYEGRSA